MGSRELAPRFAKVAGKFVGLSNFLGRAEFRRTEMYNEHFRHRGVDDVAVLGFSDSSGLGKFLSIERAHDFSDRDLALLNVVAYPLQAALSNASRLSQLEEESRLLTSTLEASGWNGLVVSHQERICLESPQAHSLLASYFGRDAANDRLPDSLLRWMRASAARMRQPSVAGPQLLPFHITRGGHRLLIRMLLHPAGYMLLLEEQEEGAELTRLLVLGLTRRQAQILAYIANGKTNGEIAIILAVSPRTVEKHVERILQKLGVETRSGAAAMAAETLHRNTSR